MKLLFSSWNLWSLGSYIIPKVHFWYKTTITRSKNVCFACLFSFFTKKCSTLKNNLHILLIYHKGGHSFGLTLYTNQYLHQIKLKIRQNYLQSVLSAMKNFMIYYVFPLANSIFKFFKIQSLIKASNKTGVKMTFWPKYLLANFLGLVYSFVKVWKQPPLYWMILIPSNRYSVY